MFMIEGQHLHYDIHVDVRRQLCGVRSFFMRVPETDSSGHVCVASALPTEPPHHLELWILLFLHSASSIGITGQ